MCGARKKKNKKSLPPLCIPPLEKQSNSDGEQTARGGWFLNHAQGASAYFFHFAVIIELVFNFLGPVNKPRRGTVRTGVGIALCN